MSRLRGGLPDVLTAVRLLVAMPLGLAVLTARDRVALILLGIAAITDLLDGPLARRKGTASRGGGRFDVWADFAVISAALLALGRRGVYGYWLISIAALLFALFLLTSPRRTVRYDPVGRAYGGILFVLSGSTLALPDLGIQAVLFIGGLLISASVLLGRLGALRHST